MKMKQHLMVTPEAGKKFYLDFSQKGKVVMLNLLRFKLKADYSSLDSIAPENQISGREAYDLYMEATLPHLEKAGSQVLFYGDSKNFVIGPEQEEWDAVLLVEYESVLKFMEFARDKEYLKTSGHRTAALEDSRLLPISERK